MAKTKTRNLILLHLVLLLYSIGSICAKTASGYPFLSRGFILFYGSQLIILVVYALLWQQVLKRMPLTVAFANKAVTIIWGIIWGVLFFGEQVRPAMVIGAVMIMAGIILVVSDDE